MNDDARRQVLAVLRRQEEAIKRGDAQGVVAPLATEAIVYDLPPPLQHRGDTAQNVHALEKWFGTWHGPVSVELADPAVLIDGDLAVVFGLSRMRGTKKDSGPLDSWNRRTVVLRNTSGNWRIVHEHSSYPMSMDGSGRALDDLKP